MKQKYFGQYVATAYPYIGTFQNNLFYKSK